jgi:hypothetical protein
MKVFQSVLLLVSMLAALLAVSSAAAAQPVEDISLPNFKCITMAAKCLGSFKEAYKTKSFAPILHCTDHATACQCGEKLPAPIGPWVTKFCSLTEAEVYGAIHAAHLVSAREANVSPTGDEALNFKSGACGCADACVGACSSGHCYGVCV